MIRSFDPILGNAIFSSTCGVLLLFKPQWFSLHISLPNELLAFIGLGLLAFAVQLLMMFKRPTLATQCLKAVVLMDICWIILTAIAGVLFSSHITVVGGVFITGVNIVVALLALAQYRLHQTLSSA